MKLKRTGLSITIVLMLIIFSVFSSFVGLFNKGDESADAIKDR